jgi:hypothetical protein
MSHAAAFAAGQVRTVSTNEGDPNGIGAGVDGFGAESGSVSFTSYGAGTAAASFSLNFAGGDFLVGSFNLSGGGGTFTVNSGMWKGAPVSGSWSVASWSAYTQDTANDIVSYIDQDLRVSLDVGRHAEEGVGTFNVPAQKNVHFSWEPEAGPNINEDAVSGTMTIEQYQENVRIKGSFNLQFPSGALSGNFDVPCTTEGQY